MIPNYDHEIEKRYHPENFDEDPECSHLMSAVSILDDGASVIICTDCGDKIVVEENVLENDKTKLHQSK